MEGEEEKMHEEAKKILEECGLEKISLENLIAVCEREAVYSVKDLKLVTEAQWEKLGVRAIVDLNSLKDKLQPVTAGT